LSNTAKRSIRSLTVLVPVLGLAYYGVSFALQDLISISSTGSLEFFQWLFLPFVVVSLTSATLLLMHKNRTGYLSAAAVSAVLLVMYLAAPTPNDMVNVLANPANTEEFVFHLTTYPAIAAAFFYSVLALLDTRQARLARNTESRPSPQIPRSSLVAALSLGFVLGGLLVGLMAGATQAAILAGSGSAGDVMLVQGAGSPTNSQFSPATLTVKVGTTVTWVNRDSAPHTVTSMNGTFDSGNMNSGASYKFTFSQPGTYLYTCTYHSWMKGTIVVTSGQ
jgi:plastocyanin